MTAVSQSYPNYLGGLNEQPDELKKPGQLVEALNVIPDPTLGLSRRPGFELVDQLAGTDPLGTWFEIELSNQVNNDYIYIGNVTQNGEISIFNQDGERQLVVYTEDNQAVTPHKDYLYKDGIETLVVNDDNGEELESLKTTLTATNGYFRHSDDKPLKYCISKDHAIFANPIEVPTLTKAPKPSANDLKKYYSYINLKVVDTANYNYIFKLFRPKDGADTYRYITDVDAIKIDDVLSDYDKDLTLPLQLNGPFEFDLGSVGQDGIEEVAKIEVTFVGQVVQLKSDDGDGYRNEARYNWSTQIITPGKGYKKNQVFKITKSANDLGGTEDLTFTFKIEDVNSVTATSNVDINPGVTNDMDAASVLQALQASFKSNGIDKAVVTGSGIYLEDYEPFSVSTAEVAVADVLNSQQLDDTIPPIAIVNTVAELPIECWNGFRVEVKNSFDDKNNYFLEYKAESEGSDLDLTKADGYWEEIAKPYEQFNPRNGTLPHMITIARREYRTDFAFVVSPIQYNKRTAGTMLDNPSMFVDKATITDLNYYKNRLFFFTSVGTIISSRAGEINNLFINTGLQTSPIDPIDVVANSNQRVPIYGSSVINNGMVLFGETEQYMVTTNSDLLTSETVNVTKVANYTFDRVSNAIYLGANIGFVSKGVSRFYEMTNLYDRGPVDINERSQQIQTQFGQDFNMPVSSREQSQVVVYKSGASSADMMVYRFRQENSQESSQTSWVRWRVGGNNKVCFASLPQDKMFVVVKPLFGECKLYKIDGSSVDNTVNPNPINIPTFRDGYTPRAEGSGDPFTTKIVFPTIYAQSGSLKIKTDVTANLTIHRVKLSTALIGTYDLTIDRKGYDTYKLLVEQTPADEYAANFPTLYGEKVETVPVYTRNKNLTLTISTDYDAPMTLRSMTWEGDYNRPYYNSV